MTRSRFKAASQGLPAAWLGGVVAVTMALSTPAQAQMFKDASLQALLAQERPAELLRVARERLAARPDDSQAVLALALAALQSGNAENRRLAIQQAQACTQQQPRTAECHYALGTVLGVQAMSDGMLKAARSAGTIQEALTQAQTLAPTWYPARSALVEFYLMAPGMMGGSTAKAQDLARSAPNPAQAKLLQARVEWEGDKAEAALQAMASLLTQADAEVADDAAEWGFSAATKLINDGKAPLAQPFLEQLTRARPAHAFGPYGLARVRAAAGAHADALALYDQSARAQGAALLPVDYRRGLALQALARKDEARAAFTRFVNAGKGQKASLEDARKRLAELGG